VLCDDHLGVVDEPVDLRGDGDRVVEDLGPGRDGLVRQDDEARALVAGRDEGEEQRCSVGVEGELADPVDDEERDPPRPDDAEGDREMGLAGAR